MAVVPLDAVYVVANFKETQLTHVRSGQPVELTIDGFHGTSLRGHVDSLSPASGLEFALLPPDNATGNFTKIVQRVPVKIVLDDHKLTGLLRPGMSAEPTVNTKAAVLSEREAESASRRADALRPAQLNGSECILPHMRRGTIHDHPAHPPSTAFPPAITGRRRSAPTLPPSPQKPGSR